MSRPLKVSWLSVAVYLRRDGRVVRLTVSPPYGRSARPKSLPVKSQIQSLYAFRCPRGRFLIKEVFRLSCVTDIQRSVLLAGRARDEEVRAERRVHTAPPL